MKLYRVNNDSLRCILSTEDLEKYNIKLQDFVTQSSAATHFIRTLMQKAEEEIGFQSTHGMISLKVMEMPDHDLCLTITETPEDDFRGKLVKGISDLLSSIGSTDDSELKNLMDRFGADPDNFSLDADSDDFEYWDEVVIKFTDIDDAIEYASRVKYGRPIISELYRLEDGKFALAVHQGRMASESFDRVVSLASEFCTSIEEYRYDGAVLKEHGEVIIKEKAITALKKIDK